MKKLEKKKEELKKMKEYHKSIWEDYGSELCAGSMIKKERKLQEEIDLLEDNGENLNVV